MWKWIIDKEGMMFKNPKMYLEQCLDIQILKQVYLNLFVGGDLGDDWDDWCFKIIEKDVKI